MGSSCLLHSGGFRGPGLGQSVRAPSHSPAPEEPPPPTANLSPPAAAPEAGPVLLLSPGVEFLHLTADDTALRYQAQGEATLGSCWGPRAGGVESTGSGRQPGPQPGLSCEPASPAGLQGAVGAPLRGHHPDHLLLLLKPAAHRLAGSAAARLLRLPAGGALAPGTSQQPCPSASREGGPAPSASREVRPRPLAPKEMKLLVVRLFCLSRPFLEISFCPTYGARPHGAFP